MSINTRITSFISSLGINSSLFADRIGVQRSSISHILNGRNKPSIDFIEKLHGKYPNLNLEWLITGSGTMYKNISNTSDNKDVIKDIFNVTNVNIDSENSDSKKENLSSFVNPDISENPIPSKEISKNEKSPDFVKSESEESYKTKNSSFADTVSLKSKNKDIVKVICFYADMSFDVFYPQS